MSDFEIQTKTSTVAEKHAAKGKDRLPGMLFTAALGACLMLVIMIIAALIMRNRKPQPIAAGPDQPAAVQPAVVKPKPKPRIKPLPVAKPVETQVVEDDGKSMWVSPTEGEPVDLAGLPLGCELFLVLRPAELVESPEGQRIVAALGPRGQQGIQYIEQQTGMRLQEIERILIGVRPLGSFVTEASMVVTPREGATRKPNNNQHLLAGREPTFVVASDSALSDIKEMEGNAPPMRREMELVLGGTDDQRHATLIVAPGFLFGEGRKMWQGSIAGLRDPLFDLLPDNTRCAAVSMHADENFFAEVRLSATIDERPWVFATQFADKVATWPTAAERAIAGVTATPYSAGVVARLPAMLRALSRYQRVGSEDDHALLRVYLPPSAGHNLLMAGELLLAEQMAGGGPTTVVSVPAEEPKSIDERLAKQASLSFARDTLEMAVKLLGDEIGVEIVLMGGDLQLDGITKNQSFGLDEKNKPAGEILVTILGLANPDKTATGPDDPKQKLIYVMGNKPGTDEPAILVTTRAAAEKRGDQLPEVFKIAE